MSRPPATLSIDLDNLWAYQRSRGDPGWRERASFLHVAVPRLLAVLEELGLHLTAFVVGEDLGLTGVPGLLADIAAAGHEVASHSHGHELDLHRAGPERLHAELERCEAAIEAACGTRPLGFRGPAFRLSAALLEVLAGRGYAYDASTLPASTGPLARAWHHRGTRLDAAERAAQADLFGGWDEALRPLRPYRWRLDGGAELLELPVTTLPLLRTPIHGTYLAFLADRSETLADAYFALALRLCRLRGVAPSLLLHASDFVGADDDCCPDFLPGMRRPWAAKRAALERVLRRFAAGFEVQRMLDFAAAVTHRQLASRSAAEAG